MYSRVDDSKLSCLASERVLLVFSLQVVYAVHALLIEHDQPFVARPPEPDYLPLIPLYAQVSCRRS